MNKAVVVFLVFAVIGGVLYWIFSPLSLAIGSAIPQIQSFFVTAQQHIQNLIATVKQNWQLVAGTMGTVTVLGGYVANWLYKRNLQKQEILSTQKLAEVQSQAIQETGEKLKLQQKYDLLQDNYKTLQNVEADVAELTKQLADKQSEVNKAIAERNQALKFKPILEEIKEAQKVH